MKSKENLVFLGMMGSGKSSIGMLVAKKLKLNFIDIDNEIENKVGTTINKMFEQLKFKIVIQAQLDNYFAVI